MQCTTVTYTGPCRPSVAMFLILIPLLISSNLDTSAKVAGIQILYSWAIKLKRLNLKRK
jgi:hypothetical protein